MTETPGTPPGWYPDNRGSMRWWDGTAWTQHVQPTAIPAPVPMGPTSRSVVPTKRPLYNSPWFLVAGVAVVLLILAAAVVGGSSDDAEPTASVVASTAPAPPPFSSAAPSAVSAAPTTAVPTPAPTNAAAGGVLTSDATCADVATDAARIAQEDQNGQATLIKVRQPLVVKDNRAGYRLPTGTNENLILSCKGAGVFDDGGANEPVLVSLVVDSDGTEFVLWKSLA